MGILSGNPMKEPMHYGEIYAVWSYLLADQLKVPGYQVLVNHTGDDDLRKLLKDMVSNSKQEVEQLQELLKVNGIAIPPAPPEKPETAIENIPPGARITDPEAAASVTADISAGLVACSQAMGQCIREDIAMMFGQFHMKKAQFGGQLLRLNKEKGWLVPPPLHVKTMTNES